MPKRRSECGASLVETLAVLLVSTAIFFWGLHSISIGVARLWLEHSLYSAIRCQLSGSKKCQAQLEEKARLLGWGKLEQVGLNSNFSARYYKRSVGEIFWCNSREEIPCSKNENFIS